MNRRKAKTLRNFAVHIAVMRLQELLPLDSPPVTYQDVLAQEKGMEEIYFYKNGTRHISPNHSRKIYQVLKREANGS